MSSRAFLVRMSLGVVEYWVIISSVNWQTMSRTCLRSSMRSTQLTKYNHQQTLCNIDGMREKKLERGPKRRSESSRKHRRMEWSHDLAKSSDEVCPFGTTRTQTQLKITMVRFA